MNRMRLIAGGVGLLLLVGGLAWSLTGVPGFGHYHHRYGAYVARHSVPDRSATNSVVVTAFDYRAFDTLGEEFILFISVIAVVVLLRRLRDEREDGPDEQEERVESEHRLSSTSLRWLGMALVGPVTVLCGYVVTHGQLTPGGGFQGGVILMAALAFVFVGGEYVVLVKLRSSSAGIEIAEATGAAGFALLGFGGLIAVGAFFENFIPKGQSGLLTGGFIPLANIAVGVEVAGALLMVLAELLDQRLLSRRP